MIHEPLANVVRSGFVEGTHYGIAVAVSGAGDVVGRAGDIDAPIFPRSANKPAQAVAMLRCGLVLDEERLAMACASHHAQPMHLALVEAMLSEAGLDASALATPPEFPGDPASAARWSVQNRPASALAYNCSGKHAAMLATCVHNGWPVAEYLDLGHPLQQAIMASVADLAGEPIAATGIDGCGAPVLAISSLGLARTFASLVQAPADSPERRVADAMRAHPELVGGATSVTTRVMREVPGLLAKEGADGVFAAALPSGVAVAVKIADGSPRARAVVLAHWLLTVAQERGIDLGPAALALGELRHSPVWGAGREVGAITPV